MSQSKVDTSPHPTQDAANARSRRLSKLMKWVFWLPLPCLLYGCNWLKGLFVRPKSAEEERAADKEHQSVVRRRLRGLSPVHDATKPIS